MYSINLVPAARSQWSLPLPVNNHFCLGDKFLFGRLVCFCETIHCNLDFTLSLTLLRVLYTHAAFLLAVRMICRENLFITVQMGELTDF